MMLTVQTPGGEFFPEYTYIVQVVFGEFFSVQPHIKIGNSPESWTISFSGKSITLPNMFFPEKKTEQWLRSGALPESLLRIATPWSDPAETFAPFAMPEARQIEDIDIFGSIFFFLTCYEEHLDLPRDEHGRLCSGVTLIGKANVFDRPLVDELLSILRLRLAQAGIMLPEKQVPYKFLYSCDVDHFSEFDTRTNGQWIRNVVGAIVKHHSIARCCHMVRSKYTWEETRGYTFPYILSVLSKNNVIGCFNVKTGGMSRFDKGYVISNPLIKACISQLIKSGHKIGFHPSYDAFENKEIFDKELDTLSQIGEVIEGGRHHYLRFNGSQTWRMWEDSDLKWDSTVGYADTAGFKCGTARQFPVYDIIQRKRLDLIEYPLIVMEGALLIKKRLRHGEVYDAVRRLEKQVRRFGGNMTLLWHNTSLSTQADRDLFESLLCDLV